MNKPFIVAEMSASHCGSLKRALDIVDAAHKAGADAVKVQTWDKLTVARSAITAGPWKDRSVAELYEECRLPWGWHAIIFARCKRLGLVGFSTPFDEASVDFLETLGCPMYKIASAEITHLDLIRKVASTNKPVMISTGMAHGSEIAAAVTAYLAAGGLLWDLTLMKCTSSYPAPYDEVNLAAMHDLRAGFMCNVGFSDHTDGTAAAIAATALGATVIEKHLSMDSAGPDGGFATRPETFQLMVNGCRIAQRAIGVSGVGPTPAERDALFFRRSIWVTQPIAKGEPVTRENTAVLRPQGGFAPETYPRLLGLIVSRDAVAGEPLTQEILTHYVG